MHRNEMNLLHFKFQTVRKYRQKMNHLHHLYFTIRYSYKHRHVIIAGQYTMLSFSFTTRLSVYFSIDNYIKLP